MTLHFNQLMVAGLIALPSAVVIAFFGIWLLAALGAELGAFAGAIPGVIVFFAGLAAFLVGLGQELH